MEVVEIVQSESPEQRLLWGRPVDGPPKRGLFVEKAELPILDALSRVPRIVMRE